MPHAARTLLSLIKSPNARAFRRLYMRRRLASTGLYETSWQELTKYVQKWGKIKRAVDFVRQSKFTFNEVLLQMTNDRGYFIPEDNDASFWNGYANQQRTLVRIDTGLTHQTQSSAGVWTNTDYPTSSTHYIGVLQGDVLVSDSNVVTLPIKPLNQVFRDFPCRNITGWTTTGMTATQFFTMIWNQTDGAGVAIFRPFFQDTLTYWQVTTTTQNYTQLNTFGADNVHDKSVWDVMERLAEAEDFILTIKQDGSLLFKNRDPNTTASQFNFFGRQFFDYTYGHTIKKINSYGKRWSNFYSRVEVKWFDSASITSNRVTQTSLLINGTNTAWNLGTRTYKTENFWITTSTVADTIANNIYQNVNSMKDEIEFTTSHVPGMELLDRVAISYDSGPEAVQSRWDTSDWADNTNTTDLIWDPSASDAIYMDAKNFKLLQIEIDLDKLECKFSGVGI